MATVAMNTMVPGAGRTVAGGHGHQMRMAEGNKTSTIYSLIRDGKYLEAVRLLNLELQNYPTNRAALSLLGYCYYFLQDFTSAASMYEVLVKYHPEVTEYKMYYAQSLYKAGLYQEGAKASVQVDDPQHAHRMLHLRAAIAYEQDDLAATKSFVDKCIPDDPDTIVASACIAYKEARYDEAKSKFQEAMGALGYQCDLAYNVALCDYKMERYGPALKHVNSIIEMGIKEHPELRVGGALDNHEDGSPTVGGLQSVGNSQTLKETALVEAFNLKAAIEYQMKEYENARRALREMPPRAEEELDPVTLMNQALTNMEEEPSVGFRKLNFLLNQPPFPPETFGNLLLLYVKHGLFDLAADVLAEHVHLHQTCLSQDLYDYLEAAIVTRSQPDVAFHKFDLLARRHINNLRKLTKSLTDARRARDTEAIHRATAAYNDALECYLPVLMMQARVYWEMKHYSAVENLFRQSGELCSDHAVWKLNMAHVFFMQENKFREAITYYEPVVKTHAGNLLDVQAIVLANLCVSYIMTSQNEEAEELMRQIEREEERAAYQDPKRQLFHLCIVNLVIGTLYCSKGNFEFGISRIIKSLEPYDKKLGPDTWYYAKRCFLALLESVAKQMMVLDDARAKEILSFLDAAEEHGPRVITVMEGQGTQVDPAVHNVAYEARQIKRMLLRLRQ